MESEKRDEERNGEREREGGTKILIDMEWHGVCVWGVDIERKIRRDGGRYRYRWYGERGKK